MKNTLGSYVTVTVFGESHGQSVGAVLDGMPAGIPVDREFISSQLEMRRPVGKISTARRETDDFIIESGVFNGFTAGTPVCIIIPNTDTHSADYAALCGKARPGHADFTAHEKYGGFEDPRGGGHFSGRVTAGLVAAGAIAISALRQRGILIGTHISRCAGVKDKEFNDIESDIKELSVKQFAVLEEAAGEEMKKKILAAHEDGDSVGGVLETAVCGLPSGVGEPWFDSLEGMLSHAMFSIPAVKGVEFGDGFSLADMFGSGANDGFYTENGKIRTVKNSNGGINGGISNGMPVIFRCAVKPTPTISKKQETVDYVKNENTVIQASGRHDPCIVHRARIVVDSLTAIVLCDALSAFYGNRW